MLRAELGPKNARETKMAKESVDTKNPVKNIAASANYYQVTSTLHQRDLAYHAIMWKSAAVLN
jgi:hypothetical protein